MAELRDRAAQEQDKWDAYYAGLGEAEETPAVRAFGDEFAAVMDELLPAGAGVLEAGCGAGFQSLALARQGRYRVSMMDISPEALDATRRLFARNGLTADAAPGNVFTPGEPAADLVFNAGVLEHYTLDQQAAFLRGMASRSRKYVLVLVPNRLCYWYWLWRIRQSQAANWPFGKECPMADMAAAFRKAGLTFLGRAFLGAVWTEDLIANVGGISPALRDELLAVHRSGFIDPAQRCYLTAALGCIGDAPAELPACWGVGTAGDEMRTAEITASLADALALRLAAEYQLREAQQRNQSLDAELSEAKAELAAFRSLRTSATYRIAERLRRFRVKLVPPHSWRAKTARTLADTALAAVRPVKRLAARFAAPPAGFSAIAERVAATGKRPVVFLPSLAWSETLFQRPHHLAREFANLGHAVVYDLDGTEDAFHGVREVLPNLFLYGGDRRHLRSLRDPILWAFTYNFPLVDQFPRGATAVYDWIDDLAVFPHDQVTLHRNHARALREAALVATVARRLHREAQKTRQDAVYLPNAAEYERFADPTVAPAVDPQLRQVAASGRPVAGYYGALARWFDFDLLDRVATLRPDWHFVLIGPDIDGSTTGQAALRRPNVLWLGPRDYRTLPGYLRYFDVATIPFAINDITLATSPLKLYEYFSAGKPVVTTAMPECMEFREVHIARTADEFARALDAARAEGQDRDFRRRVQKLGESNSWAARVREVAALLEPATKRRAA